MADTANLVDEFDLPPETVAKPVDLEKEFELPGEKPVETPPANTPTGRPEDFMEKRSAGLADAFTAGWNSPALDKPIIGYGQQEGRLATVPKQNEFTVEGLTATHPELSVIPADIRAGIINGGGDLASGMTSPKNLGLLFLTAGLSKAIPIAGRLVSAGFGLQMGKDVIDQYHDIKAHWDEMSREEKIEAAEKLGGTIVMGTGAVLHATEGGVGAVKDFVADKADLSLTSALDSGTTTAKPIFEPQETPTLTAENVPAPVAEAKPKAPVTYAGFQEMGEGEGFHLYNLTEDIPGHPEGSTVSEQTLRDKGFDTESLPTDKPSAETETIPPKAPEGASPSEQEEFYRKWAEENGKLIDSDEFEKQWREQGGKAGRENQVVVSPDESTITKRNYNQQISTIPNYGSLGEYFDAIKLHNETFPEDALTFKGFSDTSGGLAPAVDQPFVKDAKPALPSQIREEMAKRGFENVGGNNFENAQTGVRVEDLHGDNVLVDQAGKLHFIDPVMRRIGDAETPNLAREMAEPNESAAPETKPTTSGETPVPAPAEGEPATTGIAHRVTTARGIAAVVGEGISAPDAVERGRQLIRAGVDPEALINHHLENGSVSADALAVARAHGENLAKATSAAQEKFGTDSPEAKAAWQAEKDWIAKVKPLQTEWARGGQAQQGEVEIDTGTFHGLQRAFFDSTGKDFTEKQAEVAKKVAGKVKDATEAADAARQKVVNEIKDNTEKPSATPARSRAAKYISDQADAARARMAERLKQGRVQAGLDPQDLLDSAIIGADYLARGVEDFSVWSKKMAGELGEWIKPHLKDVFDAAKSKLDELSKRSDEPIEGLRSLASQLAKKFINEGIRDREKLVDAVHAEILKQIPDITRRETMDAISGYGVFKELNQEEPNAALRDIKGQLQQVAKLEDMKGGKAPAKTGVERRTPSDEERRLIQKVNEAKRKGGFNVTDPAKQLKSALDAVKNRLRNAISDLEDQIAKRTKTVKTKGSVALDEEGNALKARRDELKKQFDEIFTKPGLTDEQRISRAEKAAESQVKELERQIKNQEPFPKGESNAVTSPKLDALKARIDALKQERGHLRDLLGPEKPTPDEKQVSSAEKRTQSQIDELERQIRDEEVFPKGKKPTVESDKLTAMRQRLDELKEVKRNIREKLAPAKALSGEFTVDDAMRVVAGFDPKAGWNIDQVRSLWALAKEKIKAGVTNFDDIRHQLANETGIPLKDITEGLAAPKGAKQLTDEMYRRVSDQRKIINQAKAWLEFQKNPKWLNFLKSVPPFFFNLATLGHGTVGLITHAGNQMFNPLAIRSYWTNFFRQFKLLGWHDKSVYHEMKMQDLVRDPNFITARRAGLENDPFKFQDDYQNSSAVRFFKSIGLTGNQGFDALKLFRQEQFNKRWEALPPELRTPAMAKLLADMGNHETGVTRAKRGGKLASTLFFAPKLEASRWKFLFSDPAKAAKTFAEWPTATPEAKNAALAEVKQKALILGMYASALAVNQGLLSAMGSSQKINWDNPRKSDWLSFKFGGHNIGIISPMIGTIRFLANLFHDSVQNRSKFEQLQSSRYQEMGKDVSDYVRGKLSPFARLTADVVSQSDFLGRPMPWSNDPIGYLARKRGVTRKYGYAEYAAKNLAMIPLQEAVREVWKEQGMSDADINQWMNALLVGGVAGGTGARISDDYSLKEPAKKR